MTDPRKRTERLKAHEALDVMRVPDMNGVYVLNTGRERRMTVHSQQVRALSLIGSLFEGSKPKLDDKSSLAVIGGGVGGVTAAVAALHLGVGRVQLFERLERVLLHFSDSPRHIDPSIFDWPKARCRDRQSELPLMSWEADTAENVMSKLHEQWKIWTRLANGDNDSSTGEAPGRLEVTCGVGWIGVEAAPALVELDESHEPGREVRPVLRFRIGGHHEAKTFDAVVIATGFGPENELVRERDNAAHRTYLEPRNTCDIPRDDLVIVGGGDGALGDVIAFGFNYRMGDRELALNEDLLARFVRNLIGDPPNHDLVSAKNEDIDAGQLDSFVSELVRMVKAKTVPGGHLTMPHGQLTLATRKSKDEILSGCLPINRVFVQVLLDAGSLRILEGVDATEIERDPDTDEFGLKSGVTFAYLIERTGPVETFKSDFHALWQSFADHGRLKERRDSGSFLAEGKLRELGSDPVTLFTDLFDSVTQRELFEQLAYAGASARTWEDATREELVRFISRMHAAIDKRCEAFTLVFAENQVLDGLYFQTLVGDVSFEGELKQLKGWLAGPQPKVRFGFRVENVDTLLDRLVSDQNGRPKSFEFSSLLGGSGKDSDRKRLEAWMKENPCQTWSEFTAAVKDRGTPIWASLAGRINKFAEWLRKQRIETTQGRPFEPLSCFADPAQFILRHEKSAAQSLAITAYRERNRTRVYTALKDADPDKVTPAEVGPIRDWYDRAYTLAQARQRDVAAFETTHVLHSHWWRRANGPEVKPRIEERITRLVEGLKDGVFATAPRSVPDAHAPAIVVPCDMRLLKASASQEPFSFIEFLVDCGGTAALDSWCLSKT